MADTYPLPKFHFQVEWNGAQIGFTEVSGLDRETEVIEDRHGQSPVYHKTKFPGLTKYSNITLKRGTFKSDRDFHAFWELGPNFQTIARRDITISLLDETHNPVVVWKVTKAWATKVQSTDLKADGNEVAIETLELAHEGITVEYL